MIELITAYILLRKEYKAQTFHSLNEEKAYFDIYETKANKLARSIADRLCGLDRLSLSLAEDYLSKARRQRKCSEEGPKHEKVSGIRNFLDWL